jgi:hypothetical protein
MPACQPRSRAGEPIERLAGARGLVGERGREDHTQLPGDAHPRPRGRVPGARRHLQRQRVPRRGLRAAADRRADPRRPPARRAVDERPLRHRSRTIEGRSGRGRPSDRNSRSTIDDLGRDPTRHPPSRADQTVAGAVQRQDVLHVERHGAPEGHTVPGGPRLQVAAQPDLDCVRTGAGRTGAHTPGGSRGRSHRPRHHHSGVANAQLRPRTQFRSIPASSNEPVLERAPTRSAATTRHPAVVEVTVPAVTPRCSSRPHRRRHGTARWHPGGFCPWRPSRPRGPPVRILLPTPARIRACGTSATFPGSSPCSCGPAYRRRSSPGLASGSAIAKLRRAARTAPVGAAARVPRRGRTRCGRTRPRPAPPARPNAR